MIKALELAEIKQHNNSVSVRLSFGLFAGDSHNKKAARLQLAAK